MKMIAAFALDRALMKWAAVWGVIIGGAPTFLYALNPATPWVIPVGPVAMALLFVGVSRHIVAKPKLIDSRRNRVFIGGCVGLVYALFVIMIYGALLGNEWWAWAFVVSAFLIPFSTLGGIVVGIVAGGCLHRILGGQSAPPIEGRLLGYLALVAIVVFIGIPLLSWRLSHG